MFKKIKEKILRWLKVEHPPMIQRLQDVDDFYKLRALVEQIREDSHRRLDKAIDDTLVNNPEIVELVKKQDKYFVRAFLEKLVVRCRSLVILPLLTDLEDKIPKDYLKEK